MKFFGTLSNFVNSTISNVKTFFGTVFSGTSLAEGITNLTNKSDGISSSVAEAYQKLKDLVSLGKILVSDAEISAYLKEATDEKVIYEKARLVKEYLLTHMASHFMVADKESIDLNQYYIIADSSGDVDKDITYYIQKEDGTYEIADASNGFVQGTIYYKKDMDAYEADAAEIIKGGVFTTIYYGSLGNFLYNAFSKDIIYDAAKLRGNPSYFGLSSYLFSPKIAYYDKAGEAFLSMSEIDKEYLLTLKNSNVANTSFITKQFSDIFFDLVKSKINNDISNGFSNTRKNMPYNLLSYGTYKSTIFDDYRDTLVLMSLNSMYNIITPDMIDRELDRFCVRLVINMEKRNSETLKKLREEVDPLFSKLLRSLSIGNILTNRTQDSGDSGETSENTSFIDNIGDSIGKIFETVITNIGCYGVNIFNSTDELFNSINLLYSAISIDYNNLSDNDLCFYDTYTEMLREFANGDLAITTPNDIISAEFILLLFRFFTKAEVDNNEIKYPKIGVKIGDSDSALYDKADEFDQSKDFYYKENEAFVRDASITLLKYNNGYYLLNSDGDRYYLANRFQSNRKYYRFSVASTGDEDTTNELVMMGNSNSKRYSIHDDGLYFVEDAEGEYEIEEVENLSIDDFTSYFYIKNIEITGIDSGSGYVAYDTTMHIEENIKNYLKVRNNLLNIFKDMSIFRGKYLTIYDTFKENNRFTVNTLEI